MKHFSKLFVLLLGAALVLVSVSCGQELNGESGHRLTDDNGSHSSGNNNGNDLPDNLNNDEHLIVLGSSAGELLKSNTLKAASIARYFKPAASLPDTEVV